MPEEYPLNTLYTAIHCYLSLLETVGDCAGAACPPIGGPYRHRLKRLRSRLAFDASPEALVESTAVASLELEAYARKSAAYLNAHGSELRKALAGLEEIVKKMSQRQDFYGSRLRQMAEQVEEAPSQGLLSCLESMTHESQSLLAKMREEMAQVERNLEESETTDSITGLMNRREMERRIAARAAEGSVFCLILFEMGEEMPNDIALEAGSRLGSQFRHHDLICRWSAREFVVLFAGAPEIARNRLEQIVPWVAGRYLRDDGSTQEVLVEARLVEAGALHAAMAPAR